MLDPTTRDRVLGLLVDEQYARALKRGTLITSPAAWRKAALERTEAQAARESGWLEQQADRLLGEQRGKAPRATCPHCGVTFDPRPAAHELDAERGAPLDERRTNGQTIVAVPPIHHEAYRRLGYRPLSADELKRADRVPRIDADEPTRGADGLLYCRATCADHEPPCSLDEYVRQYPEAAAASAFLARYLAADPGRSTDHDATPTTISA